MIIIYILKANELLLNYNFIKLIHIYYFFLKKNFFFLLN